MVDTFSTKEIYKIRNFMTRGKIYIGAIYVFTIEDHSGCSTHIHGLTIVAYVLGNAPIPPNVKSRNADNQ